MTEIDKPVDNDKNKKQLIFGVNLKEDVNENEDNRAKRFAEQLYNEIKRRWKDPGLVISIHGGAKNMVVFNSDEKLDFKESLLKVAKHSNTWIITAGMETGITKLVGDAANNYELLHNERKYKLLGFTSKHKVELEQIDRNHDGCVRAYKNNTDDHEVGSEFRTVFEEHVARECPIVMILAEGGKNSIKTAARSIKNKISLIVFKGSQRAADLIAEFVKSDEEMTLENYKKHIPAIKNVSELDSSMKTIRQNKELVTIIDIKDIRNDLDRVISKAAFSKNSEHDKMLQLQMYYNRHDLARKDISLFLDLKNKKNLYSQAWKDNLFHFINLYTLYGIEIEKIVDNYSVKSMLESTNNEMIKLCNLNINNYQSKFKKLSKGIYKKPVKLETYNNKELFIFCLILQRFEMARLLWKYNPNYDMLGLALSGCVICKSMSKLSGSQGEVEIKGVFLEEKQFYLDLAVGLLSKAQEFDKYKAQLLTIQEVEDSEVNTPMEIASKNGLMEFLNHTVCQTRINYVWYGRISSYTSIWRLCLSLIIIPLIPKLITFTDKKGFTKLVKTNDIQMEMAENQAIPSEEYSNDFGIHPCNKIKYFFSAPVVRFMMNCISYCIFLGLLTYVCLVDLAPNDRERSTYRIPEYLVYVYVLSLVIEEIRQVCLSSDGPWQVRIKDWWSSAWNKFDAFILLVLLIAVILRFSLIAEFIYARTFFCFSLTLFYIRFLQFYMPIKMLGPKVIMITKMMRDIGFFIAIYAIIVLAYGTYAQGLLFPNTNMTWPLVKSVFYLPYWQTYGELSLEYVQGETSVNNVKPQQNSTVIVAFALFMLCSNVLLLNLLIAMFGNTYAQIESVSKQIWGFYRYHLVKEYYERPVLPPPFNLFELVWKLCHMSPCLKQPAGNKFFLKKDPFLQEFLKACTETYLRQNPLIKDGNDNSMTFTSEVSEISEDV